MTPDTKPKQSANARQIGGDHYMSMGKYQPWDVLQHWLTPEEYRGWQKGNAIVYLARERSKGGDLDIAKAGHHIEKLLEGTPVAPRVTVVRTGPDGGCTHDCNQGRACTCCGA